ncbi:ubiquitin-conjugating enzyme E2-binding protein [Hypoxylon sp. FL1284]|nr:ubiquitin-conjugating enzyme E2-binding protein [Hypoxylon sp. FL1284]
MNSANPILIYAERLSNIRQISISCSLHTPATSKTKISIEQGQILAVNHDGVKAPARLPGPVLSSQQVDPVWPVGTKDLSWRLPLAPTYSNSQDEQTVPWSASDIPPDSPVACRQCQATIVDAGLVKAWKDLPSENWAEMMEFWHCHKPDHGHTHDESLASRAYGANSRIAAQSGVGFVDLTSFLLSETDISASTISRSLSSIGLNQGTEDSNETSNQEQATTLHAENSSIFCASCKSQLGVFNDQASVSLFKWRLRLGEKPRTAPRTIPSLDHCFSAMLLATMTRSGCSKSIILPMKVQAQSDQDAPQIDKTSSSQLLNIWVFNNNITFSSNQLADPTLAIKVFYRMVSQEEADKMLDSMTSDVQDINLPADAIGEVLDTLNRSNTFLPPSNRWFKEWKVGLLEKWDRGINRP